MAFDSAVVGARLPSSSFVDLAFPIESTLRSKLVSLVYGYELFVRS